MPQLVPFKLMKLFLHCYNPIWICKSFIYIFRLNGRKESIKSTIILKFWSSLHSRINISQNLIKGVWTLMLSWSWVHSYAFHSCWNARWKKFRICSGTCCQACSRAYFQAYSKACFKPILEPVSEPVHEKLGWFCFKLGSATLPLFESNLAHLPTDQL